MSSPLPWFRLFSSHYLADRDYRLSSLDERGLIFSMLLECWSSCDVPKDCLELSQVIGVPKDQVDRALTPKVTSFFKTRDGFYYSEYLEQQRSVFLLTRTEQRAGGLKGVAIRKIKKSEKEGLPLGQPEGSLYQITSSPFPSSQVKSISVNHGNGSSKSKLEDHKEWLRDYEEAKHSS